MTRICICGGGNLGHVVAGFVASRQGFEVSLLTRQPEQWSQQLVIDTPDGSEIQAALAHISDAPKEIIPTADIVLLCLPGYAIHDTLLQIRDYLREGTAVGSVVSSTGFFFEAMKLMPAHTPLFGLQRVPFIARVKEYGHRAALLGYKESLSMAIERTLKREELRQRIEQMFNTPVSLVSNFYEVSLSNSNPLLHPARLYDLWGNWSQGNFSPSVPLFYEEWTEHAAELYIAMDRELHQLLAVLPVSPKSIPTVLDYYESTDARSLARKLRSIEAFKGIKAPMRKEKEGYVPDFNSRYFTEDFPYGLAVIRQLCIEHHINAPVIDKVYLWGIKHIQSHD